jgi:hypothetical protein
MSDRRSEAFVWAVLDGLEEVLRGAGYRLSVEAAIADGEIAGHRFETPEGLGFLLTVEIPPAEKDD